LDSKIRKAQLHDVIALTDICNQGIEERNSTFETKPKSIADRTERVKAQIDHFPILVFEQNGEVIGFASISTYRTRDFYKGIGEYSIYMRNGYRGKGIDCVIVEKIIESNIN
jgi:L-amino acid N-acyltransferase YncA